MLGLIAAVIAIWGAYTYNKLVRLRAKADASWHTIDTQLRRRWDLIPDLVETVKRHAANETIVFERVAAARDRAFEADTPPEKALAEHEIKDALFGLFAIAEDDPRLLSDETFLTMRRTMEEAEDKIQPSRRAYNAVTVELNKAVLTFPRSLVAGLFGFRPRRFYALPEEEMALLTGARL